MQRSTLVWDWPVRVFHLCFAAGWLSALAIALWSSHSGRLFPYHSLIGLGLGWIVVLRIGWGFFGTRPARFSGFAFGPHRVLRYLWHALRWKETRFAGHNPGAAWVVFGMLGLTIAQVTTGLFVGSGRRDLREIHEWIAYAMIGLIAAHLLGVALHTLRHREWIGLSMIDGKRMGTPEESIRSARPLVGVAGAVLIAGFLYGVYRNYNPIRQTTWLPIVGIEIRIGESEEEYD
ncbi:MAG: cytochrome b/b6 domain-containing protein [Phycisphaeraceae bacterium]|nr:cytochrome b/b6 domain-containing protein [Phycisphaeraceae bacterium]